MATYISVTNSFSSGAVAASGEVNDNFSDIVNGLSDGTKDLHVRDISATSMIVTGNMSVGRDSFDGWSGGNAIQLHNYGVWYCESANPYSYFGHNWYDDGSDKYKNADSYAWKQGYQNQGAFLQYAASGTADAAITWKTMWQWTTLGLTLNTDGEHDVSINTNSYTAALSFDSSTDQIYSKLLADTCTAGTGNDMYVVVNTATTEMYLRSAAI